MCVREEDIKEIEEIVLNADKAIDDYEKKQ